MTTKTGVPPEDALAALLALIPRGAEIETRSVDGEVLWHGPLARDTTTIERAENDRYWEVMFRPLYGPEGENDDGTPVFNDNTHLERTLHIDRFDLLAEGNVGIAHAQAFEDGPFGTYSVIRPASPDHMPMIDMWDAFLATGPTRHD